MNDEQEKEQGHYVHRLNYSARERLVGAFILFAMLFLLALVGVNEKTLLFFENKIEYYAYFSSAKGLSTDTPVKVSGLDVGKVSALTIMKDNKIQATFQVYDRYGYLIREGSEARLNRLAVIGTATIEISAGSPQSARLPDGAIIPAHETPSLDELIEGLAGLVTMGKGKSTDQMITDIATIVENLKFTTSRIESGEGALGNIIYGEQLNSDLSNAIALLEQVMRGASESFVDLKPLLSDTRLVVHDIRSSTGDLPQLVSTANKAITKVDQALTVLNTELQQFPDVLVRLNLVLEEANRVLEAMQRVWPISSAVPPQNEQQLIGPQPVNE